MDSQSILDVFRQSLYIVMMAVAVIVVPGLLVGLLVAMFQAATQINEMTISFLPKLFVIIAAIALLAPWLFNLLAGFTKNIITDLPYLIG